MKTRILLLLFTLVTTTAMGQIDFLPPKAVSYLDFPKEILAGDFDGNGQEDVIISINPSAIVVYYSMGDNLVKKEFRSLIKGRADNVKMKVGDLNDDGKDDVVIFDLGLTDNVVLYKCISTGQDFTVTQVQSFLVGQWDFDLVDFDGEGSLDVLVTGQGSTMMFFKNDGSGNFLAPTQGTLPTLYGFRFFTTDFNNDGILDFVSQNFGSAEVYIGNSSGFYSLSSVSIAREWLTEARPAVADFNGDGLPDLVGITFKDNKYFIEFFANNGGAGLKPSVDLPYSLPDFAAFENIAHADYDNDGKEDLLIATPWDDIGMFILRNLGNATFEDMSPEQPVSAFDATFVNLDGTGAPEIIGLSLDKKISVVKEDDGQYEFVEDHIFGVTADEGKVYDLDNDGFKDIIVTSSAGGAIVIWYGKASGDFEEPVFYPAPGSLPAVVAADFNGDNIGDIAFSATEFQPPYRSSTNVMLSNGTRSYTTKFLTSTTETVLAAGDLNNNGTIDLAGTFDSWLNDGAGNFTKKDIPYADFGNSFTSSDLGHFDNDDFLDYAICTNGNLLIYHNNGNGALTTFERITTITNAYEVHTANLNNDDYDDLVVNVSTTTNKADLALMKGKQNGTFDITHIVESDPIVFFASNAADINGDGREDIVVNYVYNSLPDSYFGFGVYLATPEGQYHNLVKFDGRNSTNTNLANSNGVLIADINNDDLLDAVLIAINGAPATVLLQEEVNLTPPVVVPGIVSVVPGDIYANVTLEKGDGTGRLVVIRKESKSEASPSDNIAYLANLAFGSGDDLGNSNYVVMSSDVTNFTITNLEPVTTYTVTAFEYSAIERMTAIDYLLTPATTTFTTTVLGLEDEMKKSVSLYPNPAKDFVRIRYAGEVALYNSIGLKLNAYKNVDEDIELDVSALPPGLYIAKIQNLSFKFIKQ